VTEPHDPFVTGEAAYARYDVDAIPLQPNVHHDLARQPGIYRKAGRTWRDMTDRQRREAAACYYASITEIDAQFGTLIESVDAAGRLDDTIVVLTSDHGELLGSHGLYCKNVGGFEEVYQIPLVVSGPGAGEGVVSEARVALHDLAPTLLELAGLAPIGAPDSRSFRTVLADERHAGDYTRGFAEYHGGRYRLTQRIIWDGPWKLVWNGFDFDELYHLDDDPYEMHNLIDDAGRQEQVAASCATHGRSSATPATARCSTRTIRSCASPR
jgi:choline-sulfatase